MAGNDSEATLEEFENAVKDLQAESNTVFATVSKPSVDRGEKQKSLTKFRLNATALERVCASLAIGFADHVQHKYLKVWATSVKDAAHSYERAAADLMNSSDPAEVEFGMMKLGEVAKILRESCERLTDRKTDGDKKKAYVNFYDVVDNISARVKKLSKGSNKELTKNTMDLLQEQEKLTLGVYIISVHITYGPVRSLLQRAVKFTLVLMDKITRAASRGDKGEAKNAHKSYEASKAKLQTSIVSVKEDEIIGDIFASELAVLTGINADGSAVSATLSIEQGKMLADLLTRVSKGPGGSAPKAMSKYKRFVYDAGEGGELDSAGAAIKVPSNLLADVDDDPFETGAEAIEATPSRARRHNESGTGLGSPLSAELLDAESLMDDGSRSGHRRNLSASSSISMPGSRPGSEADDASQMMLSDEQIAQKAKEAEQRFQQALARAEKENAAAGGGGGGGGSAGGQQFAAPDHEITVPLAEAFTAIQQLSYQLMKSLGLPDVRLGAYIRTYSDVVSFFGQCANAFVTLTRRPVLHARVQRKFRELADAVFIFTLSLHQLSSYFQVDPSKRSDSSLPLLYLTVPCSQSTFISALSDWCDVCHDFSCGSMFNETLNFVQLVPGDMNSFYDTDESAYDEQLLLGSQLGGADDSEWSGVDPNRVVAGSFHALIRNLTDPKKSDTLFMKAMVQGYPAFCSPSKFLSTLIDRYNHGEYKRLGAAAAANDPEFQKNIRPMQLRVCQVLCFWTDRDPFIFNDPGNEDLRDQLTVFAADVDDLYPQLADKMRINVSKSLEQTAEPISLKNPLQSQLHLVETPICALLIDYDLGEIARQLTLAEFTIFQAIKPSELTRLAWSKPKLKHLSPNVLASHARFNTVSRFFTLSVLVHSSHKMRGKVICRLIKLAQLLRELNNFASLNALTAALHNAAISRLKATWSEVPKKDHNVLKELTELMSNQNSYKSYRAALAACSPPATPFLGMNLTDLTFIEEGNPSQLNGLINFSKVEMSYHVVAQIQKFQQIPYTTPIVQPLFSLLSSLPDLKNPKFMFELSKLREAQKN